MSGWTPTAAAARAAREALDVRASLPRSQRAGTLAGLARARQLAARRHVSDDTVRRMVAFFARNARFAAAAPPSKSWQAWNLWGGDAAREALEHRMACCNPKHDDHHAASAHAALARLRMNPPTRESAEMALRRAYDEAVGQARVARFKLDKAATAAAVEDAARYAAALRHYGLEVPVPYQLVEDFAPAPSARQPDLFGLSAGPASMPRPRAPRAEQLSMFSNPRPAPGLISMERDKENAIVVTIQNEAGRFQLLRLRPNATVSELRAEVARLYEALGDSPAVRAAVRCGLEQAHVEHGAVRIDQRSKNILEEWTPAEMMTRRNPPSSRGAVEGGPAMVSRLLADIHAMTDEYNAAGEAALAAYHAGAYTMGGADRDAGAAMERRLRIARSTLAALAGDPKGTESSRATVDAAIAFAAAAPREAAELGRRAAAAAEHLEAELAQAQAMKDRYERIAPNAAMARQAYAMHDAALAAFDRALADLVRERARLMQRRNPQPSAAAYTLARDYGLAASKLDKAKPSKTQQTPRAAAAFMREVMGALSGGVVGPDDVLILTYPLGVSDVITTPSNYGDPEMLAALAQLRAGASHVDLSTGKRAQLARVGPEAVLAAWKRSNPSASPAHTLARYVHGDLAHINGAKIAQIHPEHEKPMRAAIARGWLRKVAGGYMVTRAGRRAVS